MAVNVYAWPPVGVTALEWTQEAPVSRQQSLITGRRYVSTSGRERRLATVTVSSLARGQSGAGYMDNLKKLLSGGVNLVRIDCGIINWWQCRGLTETVGGVRRNALRSTPVVWTAPDDPALEWTEAATPMPWFSGRVIMGTAGTSGGFPVLNVTGAPASMLLARPGDFVTMYPTMAATTGSRARVMTEARSNASGVASIRLMSALSGSGRVNIGTPDEGVFEAVDLPRSVQPARGDWSYTWSLREVFEDETDGFAEVNPW